jgi:hypothetical protein
MIIIIAFIAVSHTMNSKFFPKEVLGERQTHLVKIHYDPNCPPYVNPVYLSVGSSVIENPFKKVFEFLVGVANGDTSELLKCKTFIKLDLYIQKLLPQLGTVFGAEQPFVFVGLQPRGVEAGSTTSFKGVCCNDAFCDIIDHLSERDSITVDIFFVAQPILWRPRYHGLFSKELRERVITLMILKQERHKCAYMHLLPNELLGLLCEYVVAQTVDDLDNFT